MHDHYVSEQSVFADWYSARSMLDLIYLYKFDSANYQPSREWARSGYRSSSVPPVPRGDRRLCGPCSKPFDRRLTFKWLPLAVAG